MENFLERLFNNVNEDERLDLTKKEDVEKFHEKINELRENEAFLSLAQLFGYDQILITLLIAKNIWI